jgi:hypothetical protein
MQLTRKIKLNTDALAHLSRFLPPTDLQNMALVNKEYAAAIRYSFYNLYFREPIRAWNYARKQFHPTTIGVLTWLSVNCNMFPYLDHLEMMFDVVIEAGVHNLVVRSFNRETPTDEQFKRLVHQVITRKHHLETITLCEMTTTDEMYHYFLEALRPHFYHMPLLYVSFMPARYINSSTYDAERGPSEKTFPKRGL